MPSLIAPSWLRGRQTRWSPVLKERDAWIIKQIHKGHRNKDIAEALGIKAVRISELKVKYGIMQPEKWYRHKIDRWNIKIGSVHDALEHMDPDDRTDLLNTVEKEGGTVAEYLVQHWQRVTA